MLPSVPRPARSGRKGSGGRGGGGGLICSFLEVHLEHGLSKVYISFSFIRDLSGSVGREGDAWQHIFCWNMSGKSLNYILRKKISNSEEGNHGTVSLPGCHSDTLSVISENTVQ